MVAIQMPSPRKEHKMLFDCSKFWKFTTPPLLLIIAMLAVLFLLTAPNAPAPRTHGAPRAPKFTGFWRELDAVNPHYLHFQMEPFHETWHIARELLEVNWKELAQREEHKRTIGSEEIKEDVVVDGVRCSTRILVDGVLARRCWKGRMEVKELAGRYQKVEKLVTF